MRQIEKCLMARDPVRFLREMNEECEKGWTVKPGTWAVQSITKMPNERTPAHCVMPNGLAMDQCYFAVLIAPPSEPQT